MLVVVGPSSKYRQFLPSVFGKKEKPLVSMMDTPFVEGQCGSKYYSSSCKDLTVPLLLSLLLLVQLLSFT